MNKFCIITGHFGSGKTEFALNLAMEKKKYYNRIVMLDMDIVNPYFRTKDAKDRLKQLNIDLIASQFANTNVDLPSLPPEINSVFEDKEAFVIFDVGGDEDGAIVLGRYQKFFADLPYEMLMVINTKRPWTDNENSIISMKEEIEASSRLKITGFVNNTNLMGETTPQMLEEGQKIIQKAAEKCKLEIKYISGREDILEKISPSIPTKQLKLDLQLGLPWQK